MFDMDSFEYVAQLLEEWNLPDLITDFKEKGIDIEVLKVLTVQDVDNLIPLDRFGLRIKFRQKLFEWKELHGYFTPLATTISRKTSHDSSSVCNSPVNATADYDNLLTDSKDIETLLNENVKGKLVLEYYNKHNVLDKQVQTYLVHIVVDYMVLKYAKLTYYTPRRCKINPSAKLYDRYFNLKFCTKKLKLDTNVSHSDIIGEPIDYHTNEIENYIAFLNTNCDPSQWDRIKDYRTKTSNYRLDRLIIY
ncbi:uncharacterized protein [Onthophagus taurus]|uniref:uncharacterized protein isoform X2 n=1 Tax=Onthophagus taurus TaxID=166361 RepID=UPI0039BDE7D4